MTWQEATKLAHYIHRQDPRLLVAFPAKNALDPDDVGVRVHLIGGYRRVTVWQFRKSLADRAVLAAWDAYVDDILKGDVP